MHDRLKGDYMDKFIKKYRSEGFPFVYNADNFDNTFTNPIIHTDFSDPDVICVDGNYYMTASSFSNLPGLPILHSKDLVNWVTINYAIKTELPFEKYNRPRYGEGVWAPALRYHNGMYYIYFGMPDEGIFVAYSKDIYGEFKLKQLKDGRGYIDTCPFWDDNGDAYLVFGFAKSRIGFKSVLAINKMSNDGLELEDEFRIIYDGNEKYPTLEGPKMYKKNDLYYILAPALGVTYGVQVAFRSENVYGPYEDKVVLEQGDTATNGPHQGGLVSVGDKDYFIHFQDKYAYGRIPHLQPVEWIDGWPMMGEHNKSKDLYQPVMTHQKPIETTNQVSDIYSDDFKSFMNKTFQWNCNVDETNYSFERKDYLRLFAKKAYDSTHSVVLANNLLTQKFPNTNFTATTKYELKFDKLGEKCGFGILSDSYSSIEICKTKNGYVLGHLLGQLIPDTLEASEYTIETEGFTDKIVYLRISVNEINGDAVCTFSYSFDSINFTEFTNKHIATTSKWVGAKTFMYALSDYSNTESYIDIDYIVFDK